MNQQIESLFRELCIATLNVEYTACYGNVALMKPTEEMVNQIAQKHQLDWRKLLDNPDGFIKSLEVYKGALSPIPR